MLSIFLGVALFATLQATASAQNQASGDSQVVESGAPVASESTNRDDLQALAPEIARLKKALEVIESRAASSSGQSASPTNTPEAAGAASPVKPDPIKPQLDQQGIDLLRDCAANATQAYIASDSTALDGVFQQIQQSIGRLRLSK